jgi:O-antigen ligase
VIFITDSRPHYSYSASVFKSIKEQKMKFNVGGIDRILRIVAGLALIALAATGTVGVWGWIGVVPLLTGIFKFCPAYAIFGMNTCPMHTQD